MGTLKCVKNTEPEAHGPQRSPECTDTKAIFSPNTVNVACKKNNLSFAMATNQIQQFGLNSYGYAKFQLHAPYGF